MATAKKATTKKTTAKKAAAKKATTATQRAPAARKSGYALKTTATPVPVAEFLAAVPDPQRRADAEVVLELMREATGEAPVMWGPSIVGFGRYRYRYDSGHSGEMCLAGFSPRKAELVVYLVPGLAGQDALLAKLGPHRSGKSCLYLRRLDGVDLDVLRQLVVDGVVAMDAQRVRG